MSDSVTLDEILEIAGQVLIRCFFLGAAVLLFWMVMMLLLGDLVYSVHSTLFPMPREHFDLIHYGGMLITKTTIFVLFLCPYVGIKLVAKKRKIG